MKRSKKVYGVYNIVEWYANIKAGKATVRVLFAGGAMTTQGVTPATFTTTDPIVQFAIEHSEQYHSGKIKLLKSYPTDEEVAVERNSPKAKAAGGEDAGEQAPDEPDKTDEPEETDEAKETHEADMETDTDYKAPEADTTTKVEVTCDRDAAEYIREHYGIATSKLRSKVALNAAAGQFGIEFVYVDGTAGKTE